MAKRWKYHGDINLYHGGTFYDFSTWDDGYVDAVEVTDLDSATGYRGAVLIERMSIIINQPDKIAAALPVIGAKLLPNGDIDDNGRTVERNTAAWRFVVTYACQAYGYRDIDESGSQVIQLDPNGAMACDGWRATKRLRANASLERYVRREFLR